MNVEGSMVFRSTSPLLNNTDAATLRECPVGMVLRTGDHCYAALGAAAHVENGAISPFDLGAWGREATSIVSSERARQRELKDHERGLTRDAEASRAR
jgi:hypothetical protein